MADITEINDTKDVKTAAFYDRLNKIVRQEKGLTYATMIGVIECVKENLLQEMRNESNWH